MIGLRTAYYYILAVKINIIKILKKIYFKTGFYKKSLIFDKKKNLCDNQNSFMQNRERDLAVF